MRSTPICFSAGLAHRADIGQTQFLRLSLLAPGGRGVRLSYTLICIDLSSMLRTANNALAGVWLAARIDFLLARPLVGSADLHDDAAVAWCKESAYSMPSPSDMHN